MLDISGTRFATVPSLPLAPAAAARLECLCCDFPVAAASAAALQGMGALRELYLRGMKDASQTEWSGEWVGCLRLVTSLRRLEVEREVRRG